MALVRNDATYAVDLSTGRLVVPGEIVNADVDQPHEQSLIRRGVLTVTDGTVDPPAPTSKTVPVVTTVAYSDPSEQVTLDINAEATDAELAAAIAAIGGRFRGAYSSLSTGAVVKANDVVTNPSGALVSRIADGTISGSYNSANWTALSAGSALPAGGTTNQALTKKSNADGDAQWSDTAQLSNGTPLIDSGAGAAGTSIQAARADHVHPSIGLPSLAGFPVKILSGRYSPMIQSASLTPSGGAIFSNTIGAGAAYPVVFASSGTLDQLSLEVTTAVASSFVRLAIYSDNGGLPGARLVDAGQINSATTGVKSLAISQAVIAGTAYWIAVTLQGAIGVSVRVAQPVSGVEMPQADATAAGQYVAFGVAFAGVTGAYPDPLPGTFPGAGGTTIGFGTVPRVIVRAV